MLRQIAKTLTGKTPDKDIDALTYHVQRIMEPALQAIIDAVNALHNELVAGHLDMAPQKTDGTYVALRTGQGPPSVALGGDGDLYWDQATTLTGTIYVKVAGAWIILI